MKQPGGVDLYAGVKIEWIPHHNPDLSIFGDDGKLEQKIDLSTYDYDALHALFKKHFRPNAAAGAAAAEACNWASRRSAFRPGSFVCGGKVKEETSPRGDRIMTAAGGKKWPSGTEPGGAAGGVGGGTCCAIGSGGSGCSGGGECGECGEVG